MDKVLEGGGEINLIFRRNFNTPERLEWGEMLGNVHLNNDEDTIK
jgi:hypothetical protein